MDWLDMVVKLEHSISKKILGFIWDSVQQDHKYDL